MEPEKEKSGAPLPEVDPIVHAPARLGVLALLAVVDSADFTFLQKQTGLTNGNLSTHLTKLESAGYVKIEKKFVSRVPRTLVMLTKDGMKALTDYRRQMEEIIRGLPK